MSMSAGSDFLMEGSSFTVPVNLPLLIKQIFPGEKKVCIMMETIHCIDTRCPLSMEPIFLNSTFFQTKAKVSKSNVIRIEFDMLREAEVVSVSSRVS